MALQGVLPSCIDVTDSLANNIAKHSLKAMDVLGAVGNPMGMHVLMRLLPGALKSAGMRKSRQRMTTFQA